MDPHPNVVGSVDATVAVNDNVGVTDDAGVGDSDETRDAPRVGLASVAETLLYGPLGLALEARTLMPRFVERGRNQVAMAKMIGQFAVRKGMEDVAAGAIAGQDQMVGLLRALGVVGAEAGPTVTQAGNAAGSPGAAPQAGAPVVPPSASRATAEAAAHAADIDVSDLPIAGYDLLSASQVVPRLEGLTADERDLISRYEAGTRARRTILARLAQLGADGDGQ